MHHSTTVIYQPEDRIGPEISAALIDGNDPRRRYAVHLPGLISLHGTKGQLDEILRTALAALHADDEPVADPEFVPGEVVAIRVPGGISRDLRSGELAALGAKAIDGLPRCAA